jgi:hypothetical protein
MKRALQIALRDVILAGQIGFGREQCEVMPEGKPTPRCGELFLAIHDGGRTNSKQNSLDEIYDVIATFTMRTKKIPYDKLGTHMLCSEGGFHDKVDEIKTFVHMNYLTIMNAANTIITDYATTKGWVSVYGFSEPLMYLGDDPTRFVGADWFHADPDSMEAGLVQDLRFGRARRLQKIELQR